MGSVVLAPERGMYGLFEKRELRGSQCQCWCGQEERKNEPTKVVFFVTQISMLLIVLKGQNQSNR